MAEPIATNLAANLGAVSIVGCVNQVKHHFRYLSQYHENMTKLEATVKNLEKREVDVQNKVICAGRNVETIKDDVNDWLGRVEDIKEGAKNILTMRASVGSGCWKGWCVSMRPRYILSKKVMKKTVDLNMFIEEGVFDTVAHPKLPLAVITSTMLGAGVVDEHLESRAIMLNDVMEAVRDPEIRMVRICGMGGIGKTTMAKQVRMMAAKELLFNEIAMVEVNQNPDVKLLQGHIAEWLGLQITEDNVSARAMRLRERLSGQNSVGPNKKILLILDNVWENIDFEKVGIPLQDANSYCKIILTSRYVNICKGLMHEKEFSIEFLSDQEALTLFRQSLSSVGVYYDETTAQDLVKECGGLPIAVATIAGAVNNKTEQEWKIARRQLQNSDIRRSYDDVFKCLEISYAFLESEKIKKFFRLCCLFNKGLDVPIEELTRYGTALCLFNDPEYICDARDEAFSYVQTLLHANLFLRSDKFECFKVHDIVWNFAVSASSSDLFMVNHDSALLKLPRKNSYEDFTSISLLCNKLFQVPESLSFSNLKLLRLRGDDYRCCVESLKNLFKEMERLYVLDISRMTIPSTLMSFQQFSCLRLLSLANCSFHGADVSFIGKLSNLEILSFAHSNIKELPIEIQNLKSLRLLDLSMCESCVIAPHVLSGLTSLEELYLRKVPLCDGEGSESVFADIASMTSLVVLHIKIPEDRVQLMNSLFKNLMKFKLFVNAEETTAEDEDRSENRLDIHCDSSVLLQPGLTSLLQKATRMELCITQLVTLQPLNDSKTLDFSELKSLKLTNCGDLVCLVNTIGDPEHNLVPPFRNIKVLEISGCDKLEHVLTVSAAKGLCILETITVMNCSSLKVIFWKERNDEGNIKLPRLKKLFLEDLGNLIGCYNVVDAVDFPQLQEVTLEGLPLITSLIESESEMLASGDNVATCSHPFFSHKEPDTVCRFPNLISLQVWSCDRLRYISTSSTASSFGEVQTLEVFNCIEFQAIVTVKSRKGGDEEDGGTQLLQKLISLRLTKLENLSAIVPKGYTLKWSSLKTLQLTRIGVQMRIEMVTINERQILLSGLQNIKIDGMRSLNFLSRLIPGGFSCEIRDMNVPAHDQLSSVFSPSLIRAFDHLKAITIQDLDSEVVFNVEEVRSVGGEAEIAALNKLDSIHIFKLHNMTHVWRKVPRNFEGFHNLTYIAVDDCNKLRYLFSPSIAKCLVKLRSVYIWDCYMIEEVVSTAVDEEGEKEVQKRSDDNVFFPQLQSLWLHSLPSLVCINLGVFDFEKLSMEAPNAETTEMLHHDVSSSSSSISTFICTEKSNSTPLASMRTDGISRSWSFLHLTVIKVFRCHNMSTLFPPNIQVNLPVLEYLYITGCDKLRYIFSSNLTLRSLKTLRISYCKMLEVIMKDDVEEGSGWSKFVFPTLTDVHLELLPNLEGFCLGKSTFDWPSLTKLKIEGCLKMKIFTSGCSTTRLLEHLFINSMQHNLAEEGGDINTILRSAVEKDVDNSNTALREQGILTPTGFILAGSHLVAQCSTWHWKSGILDEERYLFRKDVPCLERARPSNSPRPALQSEIQIDVEDTDHNDDVQDHIIHGPRKYDIIISYDDTNKSTDLWLKGYDQQSDTRLPLELVLQDIHESYPQECVNERYQDFTWETLPHLNPSKKSSSFIKDIFAREGVQPDLKNYFNIWLSALVPTIKCFDN